MKYTPARLRSTLLGLLLAAPSLAQFPPGYVDERVFWGPEGIVGVEQDANDRIYVWSANGRVFVHENEALVTLLDISDEVGRWNDLGLLGFALHPDFLHNGYFYIYYCVDRHHLLYHGTPSYDPDDNWYTAATIGRLTRYTADPATGFTTVLPDSRKILIGATIDSGVPQVSPSHGTGALAFAPDGTLLACSGDGASYFFTDAGQPGTGSYVSQALADGIIRPAEAVGSFRSQMIGSLNGKVLRLDPETGEGLPSNPFYDPDNPSSPASRTWTLGLRNPFRICIRPGTGSTDPSLGDPGVLVVGDVGWNSWEEVSVIDEPGMNMGWPVFEGLGYNDDYEGTPPLNKDAPNPLFDGTTCTQEFFYFQDLIKQEREDHSPDFPNPCDSSVQISPSAPTFMHHRPCVEWSHVAERAFVPIFNDNGIAKRSKLGQPGCPVAGESFRGSSSTGGVFLSGKGFAAPYKGQYFFGDWSYHWLRALVFDHHHELTEVLEFGIGSAPVCMAEEQESGDLLWVKWSYFAGAGELRRVRYTGDSNVPPTAVALASATSGPSPMTVRLDATSSHDFEGEELQFLWEFEDGTTSTEPSPWRTFDNPGGLPAHEEVELTVTDPDGATGHEHLHIGLDNTAPQVTIASIQTGDTYSTSTVTTVDLDANVTDAEHGPAELSYSWMVFLVHNTHEHLYDEFSTQSAQVDLVPTPCDGESYAYRVQLTVTDAEDLSGTAGALLYPDCVSTGSVVITSPGPSDVLDVGTEVDVLTSTAGAVSRVDFYVNGLEGIGSATDRPFETTWVPENSGLTVLHAVGQVDGEGSVTSPAVVVDVRVPTRVECHVPRVRDDAQEDLISGQVVRGDSGLDLGLHKTLPTLTGLRVPVSVPAGATIRGAWLQFTCDARDTGLAELEIRAQASDDAPPISAAAGDLSQRPRTLASSMWRPEPWLYPGACGALQRTSDLSAILQEVVDRPGWQAGNDVLLLIDGFGQRRPRAFRNGELDQPYLVVDYTF